jgi:hypothetical protein
MPRTTRRNFNTEVGESLALIFTQHGGEELTLRDVVRLAVPQLDRGMLDAVREEAVLDFIRRVLRSQEFTDEHGDRVRKFHSYKKFVQTEDGSEKQLDLWKSIETMDRGQMVNSAKARLQQADKLRERVRADVRYWDEHVAPTLKARPIGKQLGL